MLRVIGDPTRRWQVLWVGMRTPPRPASRPMAHNLLLNTIQLKNELNIKYNSIQFVLSTNTSNTFTTYFKTNTNDKSIKTKSENLLPLICD